MSEKSVYVAAPLSVKIQETLSFQIKGMAKDVGLEVVDDLYESSVVVVVFDTLFPKGMKMLLVEDVVQEVVTVPIPPQFLELIGIGMQAKGIADYDSPSIVLPNTPQEGVRIKNLPSHFKVASPGGVFAKLISNVQAPSPMVMFDFGRAVEAGIPIIGVGLSTPFIAGVQAYCDLVVIEKRHIQGALKKVADEEDVREALVSHQVLIDRDLSKNE